MKRRWRTWFTGWLLLLALLSSSACNPITAQKGQAKTETVFGEGGKMGDGTARTYAELNADDSLVSLGIIYTQTMLEGLPTEPNMKSRCFDINTKPVPAPYLPANYKSIEDAVAAMGDHLVDSTAPELADPPKATFTHSFNYGAYDGHIIFYEPMIANDFLLNQPDECKAFSLPAAWENGGYYPTEYCIRYRADSQETAVSLEKFIYREAS